MCFAKMSSVLSNTFNKHAILKLPTCFNNTLCFLYIYIYQPPFSCFLLFLQAHPSELCWLLIPPQRMISPNLCQSAKSGQ